MQAVITDRLESGIRSLVDRCTGRAATAVKLTLLETKPRSTVVRASLHSPWRGQHDLIVKQSAGEGATARFDRELAALRVLGAPELDPPVAPLLFGFDSCNHLFLLEDLGEQSLASSLLGRDREAACAALLEYSRALGRLHAATSGQVSGTGSARSSHGNRVQSQASCFQRFCEALGVDVCSSFTEEVRTIVTSLSRPGPFHVLTHGDPCPDNARRYARGTAFLDFETSSLGHALLDAAYLCMGFPTCWCAAKTPDDILAQGLRAYRRELSATVPQAEDEAIFARHLQCACARWLFDSTALVPRARRGSSDFFMAVLSEDWSWGCSTARQRVLHRLQQFSRFARNHDHLPAVSEAATRLHHILASRWSADGNGMAYYPAFCRNGERLSP